jgi:hypothetical protein
MDLPIVVQIGGLEYRERWRPGRYRVYESGPGYIVVEVLPDRAPSRANFSTFAAALRWLDQQRGQS